MPTGATEGSSSGPTPAQSNAISVGYSQPDPTLDFTHEQFDPLKALKTRNLPLPYPKVCAVCVSLVFSSERTHARWEQGEREGGGVAKVDRMCSIEHPIGESDRVEPTPFTGTLARLDFLLGGVFDAPLSLSEFQIMS